MKKTHILLFTGVLALSACSMETKTNTEQNALTTYSGQIIKIDPKEYNKSFMMKDAGSIIEDVEYIQLETLDSSLISNISELQFTNNQYYIFDEQLNQLIVFDQSGKYIRRIGKVGLGPGEYIKITGFHANELGAVSIYCERNQAVLNYDVNGNFINKEPIGAVVQDIYKIGNDCYFYADYLINEFFFSESYPSQYRLFTVKSSKCDKSYLPWEFNEVFMSSYPSPLMRYNTLYELDGTLNLIEPLGNTSYEIVNNEIKPKYYIDFGKYNLPITYNTSISGGELKEKLKSSAQIDRFLETKDHLIIGYSCDKQSFYSLFNKHLNQVIPIGGFMQIKKDGIMVSKPIATVQDKYVFPINAHNMITLLEAPNCSPKIKERFESFSDSDNPILAIIKFK